jgi:hypothetical protein
MPTTLRHAGRRTQLFVADRPFLIVGGELGNSTASDLPTLARALDRCVSLQLNAVLLPVCWDLVEPREGAFDFSLIQGAFDLARERDLKLIYLWFGTWKNGMSCYVPAWVKRDLQRFPRVKKRDGSVHEVISPACDEACIADAKAFAALMRWTAEVDPDPNNVVLAQVENEIGLMPDARDYSEHSLKQYAAPVPGDFLDALRADQLGPEIAALWRAAGAKPFGTWAELFGDSLEADEVFTAWQFARYVERVAVAGKREHALPMFTNAALIRPSYRPGQYPSAGPLPHFIELWQKYAPSLEMICPDIYFPNFAEWCARYDRSGNPMFIPEMAPSTRCPANAVYAIAEHGSIGVGPFAIEDLSDAKEPNLVSCFAMLRAMSDVILAAQQDGRIRGITPDVGFDWSIGNDARASTELAGIRFEAKFDRPAAPGDVSTTELPTLGPGRWETPPRVPLGSAMIIQLDADEFLILGSGVVITFHPADGQGLVGIESAREGTFTPDGTWQGGRWLNGDQTHQGRHVQLYDGRWTVQRVRLYRYE